MNVCKACGGTLKRRSVVTGKRGGRKMALVCTRPTCKKYLKEQAS